MEYKDFEAFKQEIKAWLDTHQDEYIAFQNNINGKSLDDFFLLYSKIAPNFQNKVNSIFYADIVPSFNDSSPIKLDDDEVSAIKEAFSNLNESSVVTSIFAWIFFGKFFEKMVEVHINLLEQLYKPESLIEKVKKWLIGRFVGNTADPINVDDYEIRVECTIKELVAKSIELHFRTKQDWLHYIGKNGFDNKLSNVVAKNAIEDALSKTEEQIVHINKMPLEQISEPALEPNQLQVQTFESQLDGGADSASDKNETMEKYLCCDNKDYVIKKIISLLAIKSEANYQAYIYVALQELGYLIKCPASSFHNCLKSIVPNIDLKGERNFQKAVKKIYEKNVLDPQYSQDIEHVKDALIKSYEANSNIA